MRLYKRPLFAIGVSLFLVLAVIIITTLIYGNSVHSALKEETDTYMEELTEQSARLIYERVKSDQTYLEGLAASISELDMPLSSPGTLSILSQWIDITRFKWMAVADADGTLYVPGYPETPDISREPYFQSGILGESSVMWLPEIDGKSEKLVISVPIHDNGEPEGVLLGRYSMENLAELFTIGAFDGKGYNYVMKSDGGIIFRALTDSTASEYKTLDEIADNTSNTLTPGDVDAILHNMETGAGGSITYERDGQERIMKYIPVGINDWNLALVIPSDVIDAKAQAIIKSTSFYSGVMILSFSFIAILIFYLKHQSCRGLTKILNPFTGPSPARWCNSKTTAIIPFWVQITPFIISSHIRPRNLISGSGVFCSPLSIPRTVNFFRLCRTDCPRMNSGCRTLTVR